MGAAHVRPSRCVEPDPRRRSSVDRVDSRQLPLLGPRHSEREHRRHPRRQAVLRADRGRAASDDGLPELEPALPQHAGAGRPAARGIRRSDSSARLPRLLVARDLQRPVSRRLRERCRRRRLPLVATPARRSSVTAARADQGRDASARRRQRRGVHRVRGQRRGSAGAREHAHRARLRGRSAAPPQSRHALAAGRHQHRHELRARRARSQLRCRARCVGLRARPQGNERAGRAWRAPSSSRSRVSCRPSGPTSSRFRP